jgi:hypothetical protein
MNGQRRAFWLDADGVNWVRRDWRYVLLTVAGSLAIVALKVWALS